MNQGLSASYILLNSAVIGISATVIMDIWALILLRFFNIKPLNFTLVGRWICHMPRGVLYHKNINAAEPAANETTIGWFAHYLIGVIFAAIFLLSIGESWLAEPKVFPAIIFGGLTVVFPYFLMQPCLGLGIAASKTPNPKVARIRSLVTHLVFGLGLYFSAIACLVYASI